MKRMFSCILLLLSTQVLAINCDDIWTSAIRSNSPQPVTINYPASPNETFPEPLQPIDYYYPSSGSYSIPNNTTRTTVGATTRLFINGDLTIDNNSVLNSGGAPENFILVVSGSLVLNNNVVINGFVLAGGAVQLNNNAVINGAVTAKGAIANSGSVNYRPEAIPALAGGDLCGELLAIDDFESYSPGSIAGQNGGIGWNGGWTGVINRQQITDTSANLLRYSAPNNEFIAGGERGLMLSGSSATAATRLISSRRTDDVVYVSMLVRFDIASGNNLFASLWFDQTGFSNVPNIGLKSNRGSGGGAEDIMVRTRTNNDVYSTPIVNGETYLIVGRMAKTNPGANQPYDQWQLWVNPATLSDEPGSPDVSTTGVSDVVSFREIGFRTENLSASDRVTIDRMAIGKTWQEVVTPSEPEIVCLADTFSDAVLSDTWVTARSNGSFTPQIINGRLRMTQAVANQATSATYQRLYPAADNLVIVTFDYRAYGGSGADGLAVVLSDATVTPQPGSFGGPLGYGFKPGIAGFAGGWLGFGLDEFGNFSNEGGAASKGRRQQSVVVRGSGSGTSGYRYLRGTCNNGATNPAGGCLSPRVDGNEANPHRYRFTIDSRSAGTTLVSVERDHGTGYITLIEPFDARAQPGQAAVPENFFLSLTGSTGGSTNIRELDNLSICALRSTPVGQQIDHFEFDYSGQALTCKPETLTVRACANAACSALITDPVKATLSPATVANGGWVGGNVLNFTGGRTTVDLRRNVAGNTLIGVSSSVPTTRPLSQTLCRAGAGALTTAACNINFASAGLVFNVPDGIANQPATNIKVAAVRQSDVSQQCVPQFANVSRSVGFWGTYIDPGVTARPASLPLQVNGANISLSETSPTAIPLNFDANGEAMISVNYADAGQVQLSGSYRGNAANDDNGLVLNGADPFIRRPAGLCVKNAGHCAAADASCPVFKRAGEPFELTISAHAWQAGSTDICANPVTPNFQLANIALGHSLIAPTGVPGTLSQLSYSHQRAVNGSTTVVQNVSEVGVFRFDTAAATYLTMADPVPAAIGRASGRFVPADFALSDISSGAACDTFSYMQQPFALGFTLTARNTLGERTRNYFGAFTKSTLLLQAENADNGSDLTARLTSSGFGSWALGQQLFSTTELRFNRQASGVADGPFSTLAVALNVIDADGSQVANPDTNVGNIACAGDNSCNAAALMLTDVRYGRMQMANGFGPEFDDLPVNLTAEYWDGVRFLNNTADNCSVITAASLTLSNSLSTAEANAAQLNSGKTPAGGLLLLAPDASGTVGATYQVPLWLQYDWNDDGSYNDSPVAEFMFGRYRGNPRQIYWRERF
jgi:MSHA biogenesis protein MshQ